MAMKKSNRQQVHYHAMLLCCCHDLLGSRLHQYLLHLHNAYLSLEATLLLQSEYKVSGSKMQPWKV